MEKKNIIIGSRGSKLALIYANKVRSELQKDFTGKIEMKKIVTSGDENQRYAINRNRRIDKKLFFK